MYMSLMESKMEALYRGEQVLLMTLTSFFPEKRFMTQEDFMVHVAWPTDPTQASGGARSFRAAAMEEDVEDEEEEEDEDEEEEEEEEDDDDFVTSDVDLLESIY
ncbi:hypothetical protein LR48_Vigan07g188700 [Vigna angularis]|uniref:Uncharacterized protein n=1 Tax=Phaseolus angularis TaxID=3914 RepID=A0A0L9UZH4_PHAAN|nr:hypothetical protein LR48_Vigan07g188700 [Vigna angularis]